MEVSIKNYEDGNKRRKVNKRQPMLDISQRFWYERDKILLELINKDADKFLEVWRLSDIPGSYNVWPEMRMRACMLGSKGRTLKVRELTEEELKYTIDILNKMVDDYIKDYRERLMR
jgi:hypothetical protein